MPIVGQRTFKGVEMSAFAIIAAAGLGVVALAILLSFNTSMGGTRSDYNDGSGCLFSIGAIAAGMGVVGLLVSWVQS